MSMQPDASAVPPRTVWEDDFNGAAGSQPDPTKWTADTGGDGWGNAQLQYYTADAARVDGNGNLVITSQPPTRSFDCWYGACRYQSGRLTTFGKFEQRYGHFEARLQFPQGRATWPALWMMGSDRYDVGWPASGEIDIAEHVGRESDKVFGAVHGPGFSGKHDIAGEVSVTELDFHVYAIDWTPDDITWRVDGKAFHHVARGDTPQWVFDKPFFLVINLAMGGQRADEPRDSDNAPLSLVVDYVKVSAPAGS